MELEPVECTPMYLLNAFDLLTVHHFPPSPHQLPFNWLHLAKTAAIPPSKLDDCAREVMQFRVKHLGFAYCRYNQGYMVYLSLLTF